MIALSALRGYVLEELLAWLIQDSGFDLLVDATQDPAALCSGGNGLRIRGRGADHQVDVLGQLRARVRFSFPIRLFVEAKFRGDPSGLADVRNALGVLNDVNEHYSTAGAEASEEPYARYHYRYALFSASGFTRDAQLFAVAQQITLVDLRRPAFGWLLQAASRLADALLALAELGAVSPFPVRQIREAMRRALGTWPLAVPGEDGDDLEARLPAVDLARIVAQAGDLDGRLYVVLTDTPFWSVVSPDDPEEADEFLRGADAVAPAGLSFAGAGTGEGEWTLTLGAGRPVVFRLALPPVLEGLVLGSPLLQGDLENTAAGRLAVLVAGREVTLPFDPLPRPGPLAQDPARLRADRLRPDLVFRADDERAPSSTWSESAARELLRRLKAQGWPQAEVIEQAASSGGRVGRDQVYATTGYEPPRTLRGFTRPPRRVTLDLVREGLVPEGAAWPLLAAYTAGVQATYFYVPEEFTRMRL